MLLNKQQSCIVLIDVQEKLAPLVQNSAMVLERCQWIVRLANELEVPLLISEQYPQGLGHTIEPLRSLVAQQNFISKTHFSCMRDVAFRHNLVALNKRQLLLIGIETHVCILQTALDLREAGYEVFVVVDAVSSRSTIDHKYGLKRLRQMGVQLITGEMVFFEWFKQADTEQFKLLSPTYLKVKNT